jgi:hypothetical protein
MQLTAAAVTPPAEHAARRPAAAADAAAADADVRRKFWSSMLRYFTILILLSGLSGASGSYTGQSAGSDIPKLVPVDEAGKNPSFYAFREKLLSAIASQDTAFLIDCISSDIPNGPNGKRFSKRMSLQMGLDSASVAEKFPFIMDESLQKPKGKRYFCQVWFPDWDNPLMPSIWPILKDVLTMGGAFADQDCTIFRAPYVWAAWSWNSDYCFAVTAESAPLYADSLSTNAPMDTLSYDLLFAGNNEIMIGGPPSRFVNVRTAQGKVGAIERKYVRSPFDAKAEFRYLDGRWQMALFSNFD